MTTTTCAETIEDRSLAHLLYALMSGFPLLLLPLLVGLFINLSQRQLRENRLLASHLRWQRQSNIIFLALLAIGYSLPLSWLSVSLFLLGILWFCHRIIKGWLSLLDGVEV